MIRRFAVVCTATLTVVLAVSFSHAQTNAVTLPAPVAVPADHPQGMGMPVGVPVAVVQPTVSAGTVGGEVLTWVATAFGAPLGALLTAWLWKLFQAAGIQASAAAKEQLQKIIVNGINLGAARAQEDLRGKAPIEIKNAAVAQAVEYTQAHGDDLLKKLGLDPQSGEAVEAIRARIETAIADENTPTAPVLDPVQAPPKV